MSNIFSSLSLRTKNILVFATLWSVSFFLYFPIARAGWVIDAAGFIYNLRHQSFWDFINRTTSPDKSFYQLFTLHYYIFYKLWGLNPWLWSALYITIHAVNAFLVFILLRRVLADTGVQRNTLIPLAGVFIFTMSPHISEIIVCRAYFHYLQSFCFILLMLLCVQKYQHEQKNRYALLSIVLFVFAVFTLEIFYITPFLLFAIAFYYRRALGYDRGVFKRTIAWFILPQLILLAVYFAALYATYHVLRPHKIGIDQTIVEYLSKLPKYLFHIVLLGRYFSPDAKKKIYAICESWPTIILFYALLLAGFVYIAARIRKFGNNAKALSLLLVLSAITLAFLIPLPFPGHLLLVFYDRYTYFADAFIFTALALAVSMLVRNKYILIGLFCIYIDFNMFFTVELNTYWMRSNDITEKLLHTLPDAGNKTILLLNIPENMNGAPMIGAQPESMFKVMKEVYTDTILRNPIYDVASYNMTYDQDGAHVMVINDTLLHVTLNQWNTWWWYEGHGAKSYETKDYRVNMVDPGHWYELVLKRPASEYLLLYSIGDKWRTVDMRRKNEDLY